MARSKRSKRCTRKKSQKTRNYRACRARQEWLSKDDKVSRSPNLKLKQKLNLYILRHRKKLVDDLADEFDEVYANLAVKEESLFEDPVTTKKFQDVTFSSTAMHIGCGMVRLKGILSEVVRAHNLVETLQLRAVVLELDLLEIQPRVFAAKKKKFFFVQESAPRSPNGYRRSRRRGFATLPRSHDEDGNARREHRGDARGSELRDDHEVVVVSRDDEDHDFADGGCPGGTHGPKRSVQSRVAESGKKVSPFRAHVE